LVINEATLLAKFEAAVESETLIAPFAPPTEMMTLCPRPWAADMSEINCASV
jgi:hypothetical protein